MPAQIINGKKIADKILLDIKKQITNSGKTPGLAAILIGDNPASKMYLRLKEKACQKVGADFYSYFLDDDCSEEKIIDVINFLNQDHTINGILVQLPLPKKYNPDKIIQAIDPKKDVDGFHSQTKMTSPNVLGIIELIKATKTNLKNKKITILSNSEIFAQPFKALLPDSKINHLNPKDEKLEHKIGYADILIVAIGQANFIKPEMIKKDAILIDVGINKVPASAKATAGNKDKTLGDIDPKCDKVAAFRSPVPGGVGPMTVAMLLQNLLKLS